MKIYEATVIDKCAGAEPISYESYVAVLDNSEQQYDVYAMDRETDKYITAELEKHELTDEDIHYYFTEDEFDVKDDEIETEEFKYLIGKRVA